MSLYDELLAGTDVAAACARALGEQLGDAERFHADGARSSVGEVLAEEGMRAITLAFSGSDESGDGTIALITTTRVTDALERGASDEILLTAAASVIEAALQGVAGLGGFEADADAPIELDVNALDSALMGELVVYPILEGDDTVACLAVALAQAGSHADPAATEDRGGVVSDPPFVLADVEMGVTAELGRCRMSVRELLALTPGAVIDLDRAAGAPVDLLVNGTLIARGEVVVIDEEFGIRISELLNTAAVS
ncbi:MAG TPA: flagellar motor switch protein FliN [Acidimicrobiia bacterium]|nr:flagellar motor switch protein FliN [Acidimicrobiia bacterium]